MDYKQQKEIWKDAKGYEGYYQVSNKGRIKSLDRVVLGRDGYQYNFKGRIMILSKTANGYLRIDLSINSRRVSWVVHRLVATAFIPNLSNKLQVNHIDSDRSNNNVKNLEWVTSKENRAHGIEFGNVNGIPEKYNIDVIELYKNGNSFTQIGKMYMVCPSVIGRILKINDIKARYTSMTHLIKTSYDKQKIINLYHLGLTPAKIADDIGISRKTVTRLLIKNNIVLRTHSQTMLAKSSYNKDKIIGLYKLGLSLRKISKIIGEHNATVYDVLRRNNIKTRNKADAHAIKKEIKHILAMPNEEILKLVENKGVI